MEAIEKRVKYNRSRKVYQAFSASGELIAEGDTREKAEFLLLDHVDPALAAWVRYVWKRTRSRPVAERAFRAAKMLLAGCHPRQAGRGWLVDSQSQVGVQYFVVSTDRGWTCQCQDWQNGGTRSGAPYVAGDGFVCKHILAVFASRAMDSLKKSLKATA